MNEISSDAQQSIKTTLIINCGECGWFGQAEVVAGDNPGGSEWICPKCETAHKVED